MNHKIKLAIGPLLLLLTFIGVAIYLIFISDVEDTDIIENYMRNNKHSITPILTFETLPSSPKIEGAGVSEAVENGPTGKTGKVHEDAVTYARAAVGKLQYDQYKRNNGFTGGLPTSGYCDCSSFIGQAYTYAGAPDVPIISNTRSLYDSIVAGKTWIEVDCSKTLPGDIKTNREGHVIMITGAGESEFTHCSNPNKDVYTGKGAYTWFTSWPVKCGRYVGKAYKATTSGGDSTETTN